VVSFGFQGVKGIQPVERVITVVPSSQPASIEVAYVDGDGQTISLKRQQEIVGVCGDAIKGLS
jgi:hypothetical protein